MFRSFLKQLFKLGYKETVKETVKSESEPESRHTSFASFTPYSSMSKFGSSFSLPELNTSSDTTDLYYDANEIFDEMDKITF